MHEDDNLEQNVFGDSIQSSKQMTRFGGLMTMRRMISNIIRHPLNGKFVRLRQDKKYSNLFF